MERRLNEPGISRSGEQQKQDKDKIIRHLETEVEQQVRPKLR